MSDLGPLLGAMGDLRRDLHVVNTNIEIVGRTVEGVALEQQDARRKLDELYDEFQAFLAEDVRQKERQFATTRVIEVRQQLDKTYGHYDEVRRHITGILQAADLKLVRQDTILVAAEELMISCPGYWLAPALVALVGWLNDRRPLAQNALAEAIKRDDGKTSLFFALVCRRAGRREACVQWLSRYFQNQDPFALDREVILMMDAAVNGVFGGGALETCSEIMDGWIDELEQQAGFVDEQRARWLAALEIMAPIVPPGDYPILRANSPTWPALEATLAGARRNQVVLDFLNDLFTGEIVAPTSLEAAVDLRLTSLVTDFDEAELPLRREERRLQLIVDEGGDMSRAAQRFDVEADAFAVQSNFAETLTNAAMFPERSGATRATRRYAVAKSKAWVVAGFSDLLARDRAAVPANVEIKAGSWTGSSRNGSEEAALVADLERHYAERVTKAVEAVAITMPTWAITVIGALIGLAMAMSDSLRIIGLLVIVAAGGFFFFKYRDLDNVRIRVRQALETERDQARSVLRAALAELVDLRRELAAEDGKAANVTETLEDINPVQFVLNDPASGRTLLN